MQKTNEREMYAAAQKQVDSVSLYTEPLCFPSLPPRPMPIQLGGGKRTIPKPIPGPVQYFVDSAGRVNSPVP